MAAEMCDRDERQLDVSATQAMESGGLKFDPNDAGQRPKSERFLEVDEWNAVTSPISDSTAAFFQEQSSCSDATRTSLRVRASQV